MKRVKGEKVARKAGAKILRDGAKRSHPKQRGWNRRDRTKRAPAEKEMVEEEEAFWDF